MGLFTSDRELYELIIKLREEVRDLRGQVFNLELSTKISADPTPPWDSYPCNSIASAPDFSVPINTVVRQILEHCNLKVKKEFQYVVPEHVKLEKRDEQTDSNS